MEEVEEEPCHQVHDDRDWVLEKAREQNHDEVVHAKVVEVASHMHHRFFHRVRVREGVEREHLFQWSARGERRTRGCRGACDQIGSGVR